MAIQKTQAILLAKKEIRQTSCIVSFYTKDFGKIKGLIKGVRGKQAVFGLYLQEFSVYDIVYYEKKHRDIHTISECDFKQAFRALNSSFERRLWAYYALELTDRLTPLEDKNAKVYELLLDTLNSLNTGQYVDKAIIAFQIKFLEYQGYMPQLESCVNCGGKLPQDARFSVRLGGLLCAKCFSADIQSFGATQGAVFSMKKLVQTQFSDMPRISIGEKLRDEIAILLDRFILYQTGEHLKTKRFIQNVIASEAPACR
ncbi:MAG: DNA repair protein RecO [Candidatus Omnitrophica bacterium]|nr:DNA repair protein RecO [Candidatus Omnitrophota bacterium]